MLATTILLALAMWEIWKWPLPVVILIGLVFATMDGGFLAANTMKIAHGGWVPLVLGALIYGVMLIWRKGNSEVQKQMDAMQFPVRDIVAQIESGRVPRVPGTAIFVARLTRDVPPVVVWHLTHIGSLHASIAIVDVVTDLVPYVEKGHRVEVREIAPKILRAHAHFGFMQQPDLHGMLKLAHARGYPLDPSDVTYFILRETVVPREDGKGLPRIVEAVFAFLTRNSSEAIEYYRLPRERVVEIGRQFAI
jgi:KUP system potassium uptake protein